MMYSSTRARRVTAPGFLRLSVTGDTWWIPLSGEGQLSQSFRSRGTVTSQSGPPRRPTGEMRSCDQRRRTCNARHALGRKLAPVTWKRPKHHTDLYSPLFAGFFADDIVCDTNVRMIRPVATADQLQTSKLCVARVPVWLALRTRQRCILRWISALRASS